jgi:hypothetical protein
MTAPAPHATPGTVRRAGPLAWFLHGGWYVFVVVPSLGMLSFVPFVHAALRTGRALTWLWAALYIAAVISLFVLAPGTNVGGSMIGLMIVASVHSLVLRRQVWSGTADRPTPIGPAPAGPAPGATDPAVAAVLAARARREGARHIVQRDPQMARELHIGRPDLRRAYDDGGLVDLNHAPPQAIAAVCGIDPAVATLITAARARGIPFASVDDVLAVVDVPYPLWDRIRDRAVVVVG